MIFQQISFLTVCGIAIASAANGSCLEYDPAVVTLTGIISEHTDFGPPGYGENPKQDGRERHLYLKLDANVCVTAKPNDEMNESESGVTEMQMVYFTHLKFEKSWLGKHVSVTGTLFHGFSGHHWTKVLIEPTETHLLPRIGA